MKRILVGMLLLGMTFGTVGCGTPGFQQSFGTKVEETDMVAVKVNVHMEREYVQSVSGLGSGAVAMWLLVGPFSNNKMMLYGTIKEKSGEKMKGVGSFSRGLKWGDNSFDTKVPMNSEIQFKLRAGGNRSGFTDLGFAEVGTEPTQTIIINLVASGATIE